MEISQIQPFKLGGVKMDHLAMAAVRVLKKYDRLPNNPDDKALQESTQASLVSNGVLPLCIFACPKFETQALRTQEPEEYMPVRVSENDLFEQRVAKIKDIRTDLYQMGIVSSLQVILGDNDAEVYIFPFLEGLQLNTNVFRERQREYTRAFQVRARNEFGQLASVWSLAELGVTTTTQMVRVSNEEIATEIQFLTNLFSIQGPYKGIFVPSAETLAAMAMGKFRAYAAQGEMLELLGGVLLQAESPGMWLQRTRMFRCGGSPAIPAIYPWIRREELVTIKKSS